MRKVVTRSQRSSATLRYLATGNSFEYLEFVTAASQTKIATLVTSFLFGRHDGNNEYCTILSTDYYKHCATLRYYGRAVA